MDNKAFRQAVATLIDKEFLVDTVQQGVAIPVYTMVPEGNGAWYNPDVPLIGIGLTRSERIERAVALLKEAGFTWETEPRMSEDGNYVEQHGEGLRMPNGEPVPAMEVLSPSPEYAATISGATLFTAFTPAFALMMIWVFAPRLGGFPVGKFLDPLVWRGADVSANHVFGNMHLSAAAFIVFALLVTVLLKRFGRRRRHSADLGLFGPWRTGAGHSEAHGAARRDPHTHILRWDHAADPQQQAGDHPRGLRDGSAGQWPAGEASAGPSRCSQCHAAGGDQPGLQLDFCHRRQRDRRECFLLARHRHDPAASSQER